MNTTYGGIRIAFSVLAVLVTGTLATACHPTDKTGGSSAGGDKAGGDKAGGDKAGGDKASNAKPESAGAGSATGTRKGPPARPGKGGAPTAAASGPTYESLDWNDAAAISTQARKPEGLPAPTDVAAPPPDAKKTASGLASKVLKPGTGKERPGPKDIVKCHYVGWQTDGKNFDASYKHGKPIEFPLDRVIAGWTEGLQLMVAGERRRFWIPEKLAYQGRPGAPSGMLVFDVELVSFKAAPKPPPVPADVAAPPKDAHRTKSGLASKVLRKGTGARHPTATGAVEVHYTGWTTDGKMFDSSVARGQTAKFPLNRVIAGWTEGVQLMVEGEKRRFWIPEALAYKGRPGAPKGMLVFDVELIKILN